MKNNETMDNKRINIAIIEPSEIVYEGFSTVILKAKRNTYIYWISDLMELNDLFEQTAIDIVIVNPNVIINRESEFMKFKKLHLQVYGSQRLGGRALKIRAKSYCSLFVRACS